jgi:hypothetical protein
MSDPGKLAVETGIPIPRSASGPKGLYPWRDLKVGDSFFIPNCKESVRGSLSQGAKRFNIKIATRTVEGGVRVWRIA